MPEKFKEWVSGWNTMVERQLLTIAFRCPKLYNSDICTKQRNLRVNMPTATFRSRARVIDLLGRQQIADAPTAVGELFKNSLDAGARNVWADYHPEQGLVSFRDDGLGMRLHDVLEKWLILATESRYKPADDGWAKFADEEQKKWLKNPSYGEKGIGRLSVASLGRMALLWTVWGEGPEKRGTLCLIHWHLFQHPLKLFEDLPIPYAELSSIPKPSDVASLFAALRENQTIQAMLEDELWDNVLRKELRTDINTDAAVLFDRISFSWDNGTSFVIFGVPNDEISLLFADKMEDGMEPRPEVLKAFHAFATFWDPFHDVPGRPFQIHPSVNGNLVRRTNAKNRFWQPSDFTQCDHHICVNVDENGFAKGSIENYGAAPIEYSRQLMNLPVGNKSPGAFFVEIGYVQGQTADSRLPVDIHNEMSDRLLRAGGFSIYINNVRIQPYGSRDSDFAGFEQRRLKNAGRYYFSMLRMFGGVFFADKGQTSLREKAGREGFIANGASKGLRFWLEDLFVDIADSYLGRKADREDKREKREAKELQAARERLALEKTNYLERVRLARGWLRTFSEEIKKQVLRTREFISRETDAQPGRYLSECRDNLAQLRRYLVELRESPAFPPEGVVIDGDALVGVDDYIAKRENELRNINGEIAKVSSRLQVLMLRASQMKEQERAVADRMLDSERAIQAKVQEVLSAAKIKAVSLENDLSAVEQKALSELEECRNNVLEGITSKDIAGDKTGAKAQRLEEAIQAQETLFEQKIAPRLRTLRDEILHLTDEAGGMFLFTAQAEELIRLKERQSFLVDMAQLGLVFEAANHEHEEQADVVRHAIRQLRGKLNGDGARTLAAMSDAFDIIDERIRMFDPLLRRRSAVFENISGKEIEEFLRRRFDERIKGVNISAEFTDPFRQSKWANVKRPNFLGALHNLFLNASYWCCQGSAERCIRLSVADSRLTISDTGPGVVVRDTERIFEPGFSRRPGGRGLGLYIARESLRGMGYELAYSENTEPDALGGANFVVFKMEVH